MRVQVQHSVLWLAVASLHLSHISSPYHFVVGCVKGMVKLRSPPCETRRFSRVTAWLIVLPCGQLDIDGMGREENSAGSSIVSRSVHWRPITQQSPSYEIFFIQKRFQRKIGLKTSHFQHEERRTRKKILIGPCCWATVNSSAAKQKLEWIRPDETLFRRPRA